MSCKGMFTLTCLKTSNILSNWAKFRLGLSLLGKCTTTLVVGPSTLGKGSTGEFGAVSGFDALDFLGWP